MPPLETSSIIVVADTLFYPPRRNGFSVRYYPLVSELTNRGYRIDLIVINRYKESYTRYDINKQKEICKRVDIINISDRSSNTPGKLVSRIYNFFHILMPIGIPYHLIDNNRDYVHDEIHNLLAQRQPYDFAIGVGVGGVNADILLSLDQENRPGKILCDFVDSAYLLRKRLSKQYTKILKHLTCLINNKTKRWEKSLCNRCVCIYISEEDAKTVDGLNVNVIPNCVVEEGFGESSIVNLESPSIAFLGNMSYSPNVSACVYLVSILLPAIKKRIPDIHLYVIGRSPSKELLSHIHSSNIHVTGEVDNIWDYIRSVDALVFPMLTGAGLQNKVLESMYAGKPVITSSIGNEGIGAKHGRDIYIANKVSDYINFIDEAIQNGDLIGANAKTFIQMNFSSRRLASDFVKLLSK